MKVKDLIKLLKTMPPDAEVMVRYEHNDSFNPGSEGYDALWNGGKRVFYCKEDNSVNIQ